MSRWQFRSTIAWRAFRSCRRLRHWPQTPSEEYYYEQLGLRPLRQGHVLNGRMAKGQEDEKHICPLQLETIERCLHLWSNEGDEVLITELDRFPKVAPYAPIGV